MVGQRHHHQNHNYHPSYDLWIICWSYNFYNFFFSSVIFFVTRPYIFSFILRSRSIFFFLIAKCQGHLLVTVTVSSVWFLSLKIHFSFIVANCIIICFHLMCLCCICQLDITLRVEYTWKPYSATKCICTNKENPLKFIIEKKTFLFSLFYVRKPLILI